MYRNSLTFNVAGSGGVPPGDHVARLETIERTTHSDYGDGVRFGWRVCEGPSNGLLVYRTCGVKPSATNAAGRLMSGVIGRQIRPGETVSPAQFIGRKYRIVVAPAGGGTTTRVESCTLI